MKKIILSGGMLVFVAAVVVGGTGAFFSDTETAEGNVFTAGSVSIDLGSFTHTYNGDDDNAPEFTTPGGTSFALDDLKPLDNGNINIGLDNGANEAHVCAMITNDPDDDIGDADQALYDMLNFWIEDEDTQVTPGDWFSLGIVDPNSPVDTGVEYCFGDANVTESGLQSCNHGGDDYNPAQGGEFMADMMFFAIQTRNNADFSCDQLTEDGEYIPEMPTVESAADFSGVDYDGLTWFAKSRNNNNNFEMSLGQDTAGTNKDTAEATWNAEEEYSFELEYNGNGVAEYTVEDSNGNVVNSVTYSVPNDSFENIGITARAESGETTTVDNLNLDVYSGFPTGPITANGGLQSTTVSGISALAGSWTLTGTYEFSDVDGSSDENPSVQFSIN